MESFRQIFFQVLLIILALSFTLCIRYLISTKSTTVGTFGEAEASNITIQDLFADISAERRQK